MVDEKLKKCAIVGVKIGDDISTIITSAKGLSQKAFSPYFEHPIVDEKIKELKEQLPLANECGIPLTQEIIDNLEYAYYGAGYLDTIHLGGDTLQQITEGAERIKIFEPEGSEIKQHSLLKEVKKR